MRQDLFYQSHYCQISYCEINCFCKINQLFKLLLGGFFLLLVFGFWFFKYKGKEFGRFLHYNCTG